MKRLTRRGEDGKGFHQVGMSLRINRRQFLTRSALALSTAAVARHRTLAEIDPVAIRKFAAQIKGRTILPRDAGYESSIQFWDGRVLKRPRLVVRPANSADVSSAIKFAREHRIPLAIRCGAHTRNSNCDDGLLINLSDLKSISIDKSRRVARVDAGLLVGDVDKATAAHGLATVLGECPSVGISGLALGGGLGRLSGQYGALCDNLISAEIVTSEGRVVNVNRNENPDLFWAIRGGGGNFGVATNFEFQLHPAPRMLAGMLRFPMSQAKTVLRFFRDYMQTAPPELDALIEIGRSILQYAADAQAPTVVISVSCGGDLKAAERALRPLRTFVKPANDSIRVMSYLEAQGLGSVAPLIRHSRSGFTGYNRSGFVSNLTDGALDVILAHASHPPLSAWSIALDHFMHGAVLEVPESDLAFSLRRSGCCVRATAFQPGTGSPEKAMTWARALQSDLQPMSGGRLYLNYLTDQGDEGVRAAYGSNYAELARLKRKYDPENVFRLNQNINEEG